jgi:hypothetical protein
VGDSKIFNKDPDALLDYRVDWIAWLGVDTISTSTWILESGITKFTDSKTNTAATIWLSGGTANESYRVVNKIVTAGGRTDERTLTIVCESK